MINSIYCPYHRRLHTAEFTGWLKGKEDFNIKCYSLQEVEYLVECLETIAYQRDWSKLHVETHFNSFGVLYVDWYDITVHCKITPRSRVVDFAELFEDEDEDVFVKRGYDIYGKSISPKTSTNWPTESYNGQQIEHVISVPLEINPIISTQQIESHVITTEAPGWGRPERIITTQRRGSTIAIAGRQDSYEKVASCSKK